MPEMGTEIGMQKPVTLRVERVEEEMREVKARIRKYEEFGRTLCCYVVLLAFVFLLGWFVVTTYEFLRP